MKQDERRLWLLDFLKAESAEYAGLEIPKSEKEQKDMLRALMNLRSPKPVSEEFLKIQDEYLKEELSKEEITEALSLPVTKAEPRIALWQGDITLLRVGAIVNAANSELLGCFRPLHSCIDNIIHTRSGVELRLKCHELMEAQKSPEPAGKAKITPGYNLPAEYVIHTVGPIVYGALTEKEERELKACYISCLELAAKEKIKSIAFCCISTGVFSFPQDRAAEIAVSTVREFLKENTSIERVIFNVYKDTDYRLYRELLGTDSTT